MFLILALACLWGQDYLGWMALIPPRYYFESDPGSFVPGMISLVGGITVAFILFRLVTQGRKAKITGTLNGLVESYQHAYGQTESGLKFAKSHFETALDAGGGTLAVTAAEAGVSSVASGAANPGALPFVAAAVGAGLLIGKIRDLASNINKTKAQIEMEKQIRHHAALLGDEDSKRLVAKWVFFIASTIAHFRLWW